MKRLKLVISDEAVADLVDLWTYIAEDSPERADQFVDQIHEKCATLAENPMMGHLIFYRIVEESLQVVRVLSGYRDLDTLF